VSLSLESRLNSSHLSQEARIVKLNYPHNTTIVNYYPSSSCELFANNLVTEDASSCFGIVLDKTPLIDHSHLLLRYKTKEDSLPQSSSQVSKITPTSASASASSLQFSGFFIKPGNLKGRLRFAEKLKPLLSALSDVEKEMDDLLLSRHLPRGADVVVMVVNEGEMDLFMNFVCSCQAHNLSLTNIIVFSASADIIPLISSTGAMGYYHSDFATASKRHSVAYLDGVFVDMMWYKAFSVWLLLHLERNVLFQDIDIIWLKNPFPYFHQHLSTLQHLHSVSSTGSPLPPLPDAYLSDDGQRASPRFSPFYANSGFYYFLSNSKTIHTSWLILLTFDVMQSGGSHQNVFTQRLLEAYDQYNLITQSLTQKEFTNGATYHHTPSFIKRMQQRKVVPFMFHMCWTADKAQKLEFFKLSHMWYLRDGLSYEDFKGEGKMSEYATQRTQRAEGGVGGGGEGEQGGWENIWNVLEKQICTVMPDSP
jgi:hypothetical protein